MKRFLSVITLIYLILPQITFAALVYVGGNSAAGTQNSFNVSLTALTGGAASSAATGDLVIVADGFVSTADGNPGVTTSGFTELNDLYGNDSIDANLSVNWKIMTGTPDTAVACNGSGATTNVAVCAVHVWRNVDQNTPFDTASTSATGINTGAPDSPSITPVTTGAYVLTVGLGTSASTITALTVPTGYGNTTTASPASDPGNVARIGIASIAWAGGAVNPGAWGNADTATTNSWAAFSLALRPMVIPTLTSGPASGVTNTSANLVGNITATGGDTPTTRGFAWGTSSTLTGADTSTTTESGSFSTGSFSQAISNLKSNTIYYFRSYAINSIGTGYGATIANFTTGLDSTPNRKIRLFESYRLKVMGGRIIINGQN